jgi:GT2 family glycosyltransferase
MRVGIGVTTYNRPECLKECIERIQKHTDMSNVTLCVATDTEYNRKGVAFRKNECLRALKDCDYVFLFDDDCFPIKDGWVEFFIDGYKNTSVNHFLYLNKTHNRYDHTGFLTQNGLFTIEHYKDCGGVFMFMTKDCIERVGAFNDKFFPYAFEHCEWSMRACNGNRNFNMLNGTEQYIYSHDYSTPGHKSSITDEEKKECIKNNWDKFFKEGIKSVYLPL